MNNHVVEYEPGRRIGREPMASTLERLAGLCAAR